MLRRSFVFVLSFVVVAAFARASVAQAPELTQGMKTLSLSGSLWHASGDTKADISVEYGVLSSPQVEVGPALSLNHTDEGGTSTTAFRLGGFVRYRTPASGQSVPYLTLGADYQFGSGVDDFAIIHGGVGLDNFVKQNVSIFVDLQAAKPLKSGYDTYILATFGIRLFME